MVLSWLLCLSLSPAAEISWTHAVSVVPCCPSASATLRHFLWSGSRHHHLMWMIGWEIWGSENVAYEFQRILGWSSFPYGHFQGLSAIFTCARTRHPKTSPKWLGNPLKADFWLGTSSFNGGFSSQCLWFLWAGPWLRCPCKTRFTPILQVGHALSGPVYNCPLSSGKRKSISFDPWKVRKTNFNSLIYWILLGCASQLLSGLFLRIWTQSIIMWDIPYWPYL